MQVGHFTALFRFAHPCLIRTCDGHTLTLVSWESQQLLEVSARPSVSRKQTKSKQSHENAMFQVRGLVKMYHFAIDFEAKMLYPLAPLQGWEASLIFEKEQLAHSN
jgi:hypothetical protein